MKEHYIFMHKGVLAVTLLIMSLVYADFSFSADEEEYVSIPMLKEFKAALSADGTPVYVTASEIEAEMRKFSPDLQIIYYNKEFTRFIVPDPGWFKHMHHKYRELLKYFKLRAKRDTWDCDNYSGLLNALVTVRIWDAGYLDTRAALGWLRIDAKKEWAGLAAVRQALIFMVTSEGIYIIEPRDGQYIHLSKYPNRKYIQEVNLF